MAITAANVMTAAGALLTDQDLVTFPYAVQLPFLRIVWRELQTFLLLNGISDVDELTTVALDITADTQEWTSTPIDLLIPLKMWERADGGSEADWVLMDERVPDPGEEQETELEIWYFKGSNIWFRGATTAREVILRYQRDLITITDENTTLPIRGAISFLSFRTAGVIARSRGNNGRANDLDTDAKMHLDSVIAVKVKDEQGKPVRPRRYGYSRRINRSCRLI